MVVLQHRRHRESTAGAEDEGVDESAHETMIVLQHRHHRESAAGAEEDEGVDERTSTRLSAAAPPAEQKTVRSFDEPMLQGDARS